MRRFPQFELSYETISHKKVSSVDYNACLAVPYGKKAFLWFTFFRDENVCFLMELGREKRVGRVQLISNNIPTQIALGTLLYGTICEVAATATPTSTVPVTITNAETKSKMPFFVIEDVLFYQGVSLGKLAFGEKLGFLERLFSHFLVNRPELLVTLPVFWGVSDAEMPPKIPYSIHHLQYRSLTQILPLINVPQSLHHSIVGKGEEIGMGSSFQKIQPSLLPVSSGSTDDSLFIPPPTPRFDYAKPQYALPTVFEVRADIQNDIYHLYAFGQNRSNNPPPHQGKDSGRVYCGLAYIPNYRTSVLMNGIFRNIKENQNLDYIEESDDEEDFQSMRLDKYVDLSKTVALECVFHPKFKRWVPMRAHNAGKGSPIVHCTKLIASQGRGIPANHRNNNKNLPVL